MSNVSSNPAFSESSAWISVKKEYQLVADPDALSTSFFCKADSPIIDKRMIDALREYSLQQNCDVRICLHSNPDASFQNMIIVHRKSNYYRPHEHIVNGESYHLLDGDLGIPFFDDDGRVVDHRRMTISDNIISRIPIGVSHAMFPLSELVIFHESKSGPFVPGEDTLHPAWAPEAGDSGAIRRYKASVLNSFS